ncbi:MAG TPA: PhzF family phenazine biosynthesis protein [Burkholderiales bacterium]|nr:PhzF family phenazine biosynthesis protein [Burkholderiales bacterium]
MPALRFKQVDVFTDRPFFGNPVAVVLDGDGLDAGAMQRIAAWTNLSETTFVLRPSAPAADYRVRIFTPRSELPFAGHPTIGTAHAVLEAGLVTEKPEVRQECAAGLLRLAVEGSGRARRLAVEAPPASLAPLRAEAVAAVEKALGATLAGGAPGQIVSIGPRWLTARLADAAAVRALAPDLGEVSRLSRELGVTGITVFALEPGGGHDVAVRSFAPADGVPEDPVCGSGNAAVGAWLHHAGLLVGESGWYVASQGRELGRDGRVSVRIDANARRVWIGGNAVTCIDGILEV